MKHLERESAKRAWRYCFEKLFCEKNDLIYDFCVSKKPSFETGALPTPEEIKRLYPNPYGYATGMEDSALNGGILLDAVLRRYEVTGEEEMRTVAGKLFEGLYRCATVGTRGFVARSVSPDDGVSHYSGSSRDQYTNLVFGFWRFYHSPLSSGEQKALVRRVLSDIAERMLSEITPENRYTMMRDDGVPCRVGKMWGDIEPHEFLRLPMFYAAAFDVTGEEKYRVEYEKYRQEAIEKSMPISCEKLWHLYAALQMQFSVRLLYDFETDAEYRGRYGVLLKKVADDCRAFVFKKAPVLCSGDLSRYNYIYEPWRTLPIEPVPGVDDPNFLKPVRNEENPAFYPLRDFGNAVHSLCLGGEADESVRGALYSVMDVIDYENHTSGGPLDLLGGYWAVEKALFCDKKCEK